MSVKQFQFLNKLLSILARIAAVVTLVMLVFGSVNLFFSQRFSSFGLDQRNIFLFIFESAPINDTAYTWAASIIVPVSLAFLSYIFFKLSYLLDYLAERNTPFTYKFSQSIKIMGFILITYDIVTSLLYSVLVNFAIDEGRFFYFSLTSFSMVGIVLSLVSEMLNYGMSLEKTTEDKSGSTNGDST